MRHTFDTSNACAKALSSRWRANSIGTILVDGALNHVVLPYKKSIRQAYALGKKVTLMTVMSSASAAFYREKLPAGIAPVLTVYQSH